MFHILDPQEVAFNFEREAVYVDLETESESPRDPKSAPDYRARVGRKWRDRLRRQFWQSRNAPTPRP